MGFDILKYCILDSIAFEKKKINYRDNFNTYSYDKYPYGKYPYSKYPYGKYTSGNIENE